MCTCHTVRKLCFYFDLLQLFANVKTILSLWAIKTGRGIGLTWPLTPCGPRHFPLLTPFILPNLTAVSFSCLQGKKCDYTVHWIHLDLKDIGYKVPQWILFSPFFVHSCIQFVLRTFYAPGTVCSRHWKYSHNLGQHHPVFLRELSIPQAWTILTGNKGRGLNYHLWLHMTFPGELGCSKGIFRGGNNYKVLNGKRKSR